MTQTSSTSTGPANDTGSGMQRGLQNRHIQMIALGSAIGTGLFLVSSSTIQAAGPIVLLAYVVAGAVLFLIMRLLGEMAVARPTSGSFSDYAHTYLGRTAGFVIGWNCWFTCIVVSMLELTAIGSFVEFWFPGLPHWVSAAIALTAITAVNLIHVSAFGEFEFWFTLIKVAAILAMIGLGVAIILGAGHYDVHGLDNLWSHGGFAPYGVHGLLLSLVGVTFTFAGIEVLGITAGEAKRPELSIPKAVNQVPIRILMFYVGAIGIMLIIWPWNRVGTDGSPFVLMLSGLGIGGAATLLNIVVITAALSVYNSMAYSSARLMHSLAKKRQAPALFTRINRQGVPVPGLLVNSAVTAVVVVLNYCFPGRLLMILVAITLSAEIITWSSIALSHLRFRKAVALDAASGRAFKAPFQPYSNYLCLAYFVLVVVLMAQIPDFRKGAIALPLWLTVLIMASFAQRRFTRRVPAQDESSETASIAQI
ncbi:amino acid permease [Streptomyces iranensis]|uniref:amino acid permease n=1 Tax=Streptomyces iranensis TaxID=576784 RepID=UPI0039B72930